MNTTILGDILECAVCFRPLNENNKALPCQHTFCKPCLEAIVAVQRELRCPECRVLIEKSIDELPPNVLLIRLLDGLKNQQKLLNDTEVKNTVSQKRHSVEGILSESSSISGSKNKANRNTNYLPHKSGHERMHSSPENLSTIISATSKQPYAKAVFDYSSVHEGDLNLKKDDKVILIRWIDKNWLAGECGGRTGLFPANHVDVIVPLPDEKPFCRALYDFKLTENERDRDCLIFKKDDMIAVLRRVDNNWGEGVLHGEVGIFPLSFVKMNAAAKKLIDEMSKPNVSDKSTSKSEASSSRGSFFGAAARRIANSRHNGKSHDGKQRHSFPLFSFGGSSTSSDNSGNSNNNLKAEEKLIAHRHSMELQSSRNSNVPVATDVDDLENCQPNSPIGQNSKSDLNKKQHVKTHTCESTFQRIRSNIASRQQSLRSKPEPNKQETSHRNTSASHTRHLNEAMTSSPSSSSPLRPFNHGNDYQHPSKQPSPPPRPPSDVKIFTQVAHQDEILRREPRTSRGRSASPRPFTSNGRIHQHDHNRKQSDKNPPHTRSKSAQRRSTKDKKRDKGGNLLLKMVPGITHKKSRSPTNPYYELDLTQPPDLTSLFPSSSSSSHSKSTRQRDRYYAVMSYPANGPDELDLHEGDVIVVHERRIDGWFCGTHLRSGKIGHFPSTFVEPIPPGQ